MIFRIDDYTEINNNKITEIIEKILFFFTDAKILIWVIISESNINLLKNLINKFWKNVILSFHWFHHNINEFEWNIFNQNLSFIEAENFFWELNYEKRFFIPPFNKFNEITIELLKKYKYYNFSINYKDFQNNMRLLKKDFNILETNYFFNKKNNNLNWYIDDISKIKDDLLHLKKEKINIWIEIHPQFIKNNIDFEKFIFLLTYLKNE